MVELKAGQRAPWSNYYVLTLGHTTSSTNEERARLSGFLATWGQRCSAAGEDPPHFHLCESLKHPVRGMGVAISQLRCVSRAIKEQQDSAFFFEDDAVPLDSTMCDPRLSRQLLHRAPNNTQLVLLGGHKFKRGDDQQNSKPVLGLGNISFQRVGWAYGGYGLWLPGPRLLTLRDALLNQLSKHDVIAGKREGPRSRGGPSGGWPRLRVSERAMEGSTNGQWTAVLSPDTDWFSSAARAGRAVYATSPLLVGHSAGHSNTWGKWREGIMDRNIKWLDKPRPAHHAPRKDPQRRHPNAKGRGTVAKDFHPRLKLPKILK